MVVCRQCAKSWNLELLAADPNQQQPGAAEKAKRAQESIKTAPERPKTAPDTPREPIPVRTPHFVGL